MNDYENIKNLEAESYKGLGSLNEDKIVATSDLSNAVSAICYNLSNMLDKRDENSIVSGNVEISGFLSVGKNIAHGTSLTSGIGVGDSDGNPAEVEMSAVHGAAFNNSKAFGLSSFAANNGNAYAKHSAAFNDGTAYSSYSFAHGTKTSAFGYVSHVEGEYTQTGLPDEIGNSSSRQTYGAFSHAEGDHAKAIGLASHAEGQSTYALSSYSHAEGSQTSAFGSSSHSEGYHTTTVGNCSHAEGDQTYAEGQKSHTEGGETSAYGFASHTEGRSTIARARYSHAEGATAEIQEDDEYSFAWSGKFNKNNYYKSHGPGTFNINPVDGTKGFYIGISSFNDYLSSLSNDLNSEISCKLDKRTGGIVSGDVAVFQHDMRILSGNYIQATDPTHVYNYSQKNTFIQAEEAFSGSGKSYGPANTGSYGYCILSVVNGTNYRGLKLSGDISKLTALLDNNAAGAGINYDYSASKSLKVVLNDTSNISNALFSLALSDQGETMRYQISSIDQANNIVYLKQAFSTATAGLTSLSEESCIGLWENDDNAFYVAGFPEIGNAVVKNFYAQHVEGGSSRAVGKYTHAEGRDNIADVRYSHVEGAHNIAAGMATHAEGFQNKVLGKYAHVEGNFAAASGTGSHAEGYKTVASGNYSHAEGGWGSKPGGSAIGDGSHAEGMQTLASGIAAHAEGNQTKATKSGTHAEGQLTLADGNYSHAEGSETSAMSDYSHAEGNGSFVSGLWSHAEGYQTSAFGNYSHAEGRQTVAGKAKDGDAAATHSAHADGWGTKALGVASYAAGVKANAEDDYSFVWSAISSVEKASNGPGTFSIYPADGVNGLFIGQDSLSSIIQTAIDQRLGNVETLVNEILN